MLSNIPFQPFKYYIFNIKIAILYECVCVEGKVLTPSLMRLMMRYCNYIYKL